MKVTQGTSPVADNPGKHSNKPDANNTGNSKTDSNNNKPQISEEELKQGRIDRFMSLAESAGMASNAINLGLKFLEEGKGEANFFTRPTESTGRPPGDTRSADEIIKENPALANLGDQKDIKRDLLKERCGDWTADNPDPQARADAAYNLARVLNYIDNTATSKGNERDNAADGDIQGITSSGDARHGTEAGMLKDFAEQGYGSLPDDRTLDLTNDSHVREDGSNMDNFQWGVGQAGKVLEKIPVIGHVLGDPMIAMSEGKDAGEVLSAGFSSFVEGALTVGTAAMAGPYGLASLAAADAINESIEAMTGQETGIGNTIVDLVGSASKKGDDSDGDQNKRADGDSTSKTNTSNQSSSGSIDSKIDTKTDNPQTQKRVDDFMTFAQAGSLTTEAIDLALNFVKDGKSEANYFERPTEASGRPEGDTRSAEEIIADNPVLGNLGDQKDIKRDLLKERCGDWTSDNTNADSRADAAYNLAKVLNYIDTTKTSDGRERDNTADGDIHGITSDGDARHGTEAGMLKDFAEQGYSSLPNNGRLDVTSDKHVTEDGSNKDNFQYGVGEAGNVIEKIPVLGHVLGKPLSAMGEGENALEVLNNGLSSLVDGLTTVVPAAMEGPKGLLELGAEDAINTGLGALTGEEESIGGDIVSLISGAASRNKTSSPATSAD